jgi:hypothetical protein
MEPSPYDNPYPQHYHRRPRSTEALEPSLVLVLDELKRMDNRLGRWGLA